MRARDVELVLEAFGVERDILDLDLRHVAGLGILGGVVLRHGDPADFLALRGLELGPCFRQRSGLVREHRRPLGSCFGRPGLVHDALRAALAALESELTLPAGPSRAQGEHGPPLRAARLE